MARNPHLPPTRLRAWWRKGLERAEATTIAFLRRVLPHARSLYSAIGLFLLLGLGLTILALWAFAELAESVLEGETLWLDQQVLLWINQHATPRLDQIALEVTALGSLVVISTLVLVASALLWFTAHRTAALLLWVAVAGGALLNLTLKLAFGRPRPRIVEWRVHFPDSSSFPSGHAMMSMIVYTTLAYLIISLDPPTRVRHVTVAAAILIIALVGASRLYLGVHYPTDILAGYAVGFAWATLCAFSLRLIDHLRSRAAGRHGRPPGLDVGPAPKHPGVPGTRDRIDT